MKHIGKNRPRCEINGFLFTDKQRVDFPTHRFFMPPKTVMGICKVSFLVIFATFIRLPDGRQTLTVISHL